MLLAYNRKSDGQFLRCSRVNVTRDSCQPIADRGSLLGKLRDSDKSRGARADAPPLAARRSPLAARRSPLAARRSPLAEPIIGCEPSFDYIVSPSWLLCYIFSDVSGASTIAFRAAQRTISNLRDFCNVMGVTVKCLSLILLCRFLV